jgi:hypothetical protein
MDFNYSLVRVCSRDGIEFFHVLPEHPINYLPDSFKDLEVTTSHRMFRIISFPDCKVTVFPSGRMLIENLPSGSEQRARAIVDEIIAHWQ